MVELSPVTDPAVDRPTTQMRTIRSDRAQGGVLWRGAAWALRALSRLMWRARLEELGPRSWIARPAYFVGHKYIRIGSLVRIWHHARIEALPTEEGHGRVSIGDGTNIQAYVHIGAAESVVLGRNVVVGSHVLIIDHDHDFSDPRSPMARHERVVSSPVHIEDGVWIGEGVKILRGVRIGKGSVIGAGSVVTRSVPEFSMAVGVPARVIRRFDSSAGQWLIAEGA